MRLLKNKKKTKRNLKSLFFVVFLQLPNVTESASKVCCCWLVGVLIVAVHQSRHCSLGKLRIYKQKNVKKRKKQETKMQKQRYLRQTTLLTRHVYIQKHGSIVCHHSLSSSSSLSLPLISKMFSALTLWALAMSQIHVLNACTLSLPRGVTTLGQPWSG